MSDAQILLAFVFGDQPATLDDTKTALVLAKERAHNHLPVTPYAAQRYGCAAS